VPEPRNIVDGVADGEREWTAAIALVVAAGVVRLVLAAVVPLVPDEAYYWEWSRRLAPAYFDHPGAIAWLIRAGTAVAGVSSGGVRLGPVVAGTLATIALLAWARRLGGARPAWYAALAIVAMPLAGVGLILATPDVPLLASVAVAWWALDHALETDRVAWWAVTGVALGLAGASKYTAILLPAFAVVAMLWRPTLRQRLLRPGPIVAAASALVVVAPVLWWNATHGWVSIGFQLHHGLVPAGHGSPLTREGSLLGGQLGLVTPILFVLLAASVWRGLRRASPDRVFVPSVVALGTAVFFVWSAWRHPVEANWPAPALLPAVVVFAVEPRQRLSRWARAGIVLAGVVLLLIYVQAVAPWVPIAAARDPVARGAGWSDLAGVVQVVARVNRPTEAPGGTMWIAANRYQDAAELAVHLGAHPVVFSLDLGGRPTQYGLWPTFPEAAHAGDGMVLVLDDDDGTPGPITRLLPHFASITRGERVDLRRGRDLVTPRRLWVLGRWRGTWPTSAPPPPPPHSGTITFGGPVP